MNENMSLGQELQSSGGPGQASIHSSSTSPPIREMDDNTPAFQMRNLRLLRGDDWPKGRLTGQPLPRLNFSAVGAAVSRRGLGVRALPQGASNAKLRVLCCGRTLGQRSREPFSQWSQRSHPPDLFSHLSSASSGLGPLQSSNKHTYRCPICARRSRSLSSWGTASSF